ncbi:MAG: dihydrofolate reductase [Mobilicoccus sp.]|nr:dihydrofolate reductase [Mobilicoccus sp.]
MREVVLVAIVAANGVIGDGADQPFHLREDFARFKALTLGHPLVMGRATFEAIGRALPGRTSIVLTRGDQWTPPDGVLVAHDVEEALSLAGEQVGGEEVMVLGGGQVYRALWEHATRLELTEVDAPASGSVTFPEVDESWREIDRDDRWGFAFVTYARPSLPPAGAPASTS